MHYCLQTWEYAESSSLPAGESAGDLLSDTILRRDTLGLCALWGWYTGSEPERTCPFWWVFSGGFSSAAGSFLWGAGDLELDLDLLFLATFESCLDLDDLSGCLFLDFGLSSSSWIGSRSGPTWRGSNSAAGAMRCFPLEW